MTTDRPRLKGLSFPCIAAALALAMLIAPAALPDASALEATRWADGETDFTWDSWGVPVSIYMSTDHGITKNITLPEFSVVDRATVRIQGGSYWDPGVPYIWDNADEHMYPWDVQFDVKGYGNGSEWSFPDKIGFQPMMHEQPGPGNGTRTRDIDLAWKGGGERSVYLDLPVSTVNNASLRVVNNQTEDFGFSMAVGDRVVWEKDSLSFALNQSAYTNSAINYVTAADINGDGLQDLVGCGPNGKLYLSRFFFDHYANASAVDVPVESAQKDLLMVAAGQLDDMPGPDLAVACADGNVYVMLNQGGAGLFHKDAAVAVLSGVSSRMASVAIADIDADGVNDIVAGNLNGKFYVFFNNGNALFDTSGGPGSGSFKVVNAGNGQMNDVCVEDINLDTFPDLVGANANKQFYVAYSLGGRDFESAFPVVSGSIRDMNSVDTSDIDKDGDFDLIGASNDGRIYICMNLGNAQGLSAGDFNTQPGSIIKITCESGSNSLRSSTVKDMNGDEWPDIITLGSSNDGQVYVILNDRLGNYPDANLHKLFSAGQSSKYVAVAQLGKHVYPDILVDNADRLDIWASQRGPFNETISGPALVSAVREYLNGSTPAPDRWGNPMVSVPLKFTSVGAGALHLGNLSVGYSYNALVDFTEALSAVVNASSDAGPVIVPVGFSMWGVGSLRVSELDISYHVRLAAVIDSPAEGSGLYLNRTCELQGHSNYDLDGDTFNYSWTDLPSGRLIGYGGRCPFTPAIKGDTTILLRVRNDLNGQEATAEVNVTVVDAPAARLMVTRTVTPRTVVEGATVRMEVTISNNGYLNVSDIGFQVFMDEASGLPVATGHIDRIDIGKSASTNVSWPATSAGRHRIIVRITQADGPFTAVPQPDVGSLEVRQAPPAYPVELIAYGSFIGLGAAAAVVFFVATEVGTFLGFSLLLPLYTKLRPEEVLDGFTRGKILGYIRANPGAHYNLIKQDLDMPNGTLIHHLDTLERNGFIRSARDGLLKRFFPGNGKVPEGKFYLSPIQDSIAKYIGANPGVSQADLSRGLYIEPHIVKYHIKVLRDASLLRVEEEGNRTRLFLR